MSLRAIDPSFTTKPSGAVQKGLPNIECASSIVKGPLKLPVLSSSQMNWSTYVKIMSAEFRLLGINICVRGGGLPIGAP